MTHTTATARRQFSGPGAAARSVLTRMPATIAFVLILLAVGVLWQGLWRSFKGNPLFVDVAYGLPAFVDGRWWTPLTGTFFVVHPWVYVITIASFIGMGYLEWRRGTRVALAYYAVGQLFAIFASALAVWLLAFTPWPWAQREALALDVGPSGGTMACLAAAASLLPSPWRSRAWLVLIGGAAVALLYWGSLADIEHAFAILLVLVVARPLRIRRVSVQEQRFVALVAVLGLAAIETLTSIVPTDGPFGRTELGGGSWIDTAIDVGILLLVARGLQRGRRWAWVIAIILASINVVLGILVVVLTFGFPASDIVWDGDPSVTVATAVLWAALLVYLAWVRGAFRGRRRATLGMSPPPTVGEVREMLHTSGGGTLSWMTTWDGNSYARTSSGIVAYQRRAGVALVLADPLGPRESRGESVREFVSMAETAGLIPCFFSADEATRAVMPDGWRSLIVADDTIVDLEGLEFTGKRWAAVRTSLNRAGREEMTFRMTRLTDEPWGIQQQLRAISDMWVGDKGLPEMGFTLGTLNEARDPEVRLALAISPSGDVDGFLSWLPVYGEGRVEGWTLDLMRRREGGFGPVMEFLIGSSARFFADEGARMLSLSGAPLTHDYPPDAGMIAEITDKLAEMLEPVYGFRSLHRFKEKFHPRYESLYLLYRDEADLPGIGMALTRAFLPDASLRQLAGSGRELLRGGR
ncbi:bifunctional lysylphosphatidylglycerol flippase/synthetase MprF [Microbacterium sp. bgisy207]|uniref:bifunctional lysylphosphatidylglycerol flippase/synthetase MprF n=1 Tax=Microbacterium sp. bgisy207 TaxID=3413800 RepID=UPI003EB88246